MAPIRCCFDQTAVWHSDAARGPSTPSFNNLVGEREQVGRHLKAERLRRFEIDREFEFGRLLDRKLAWLLAAKDAVDIGGSAPEYVVRIGPVRHQPAFPDK